MPAWMPGSPGRLRTLRQRLSSSTCRSWRLALLPLGIPISGIAVASGSHPAGIWGLLVVWIAIAAIYIGYACGCAHPRIVTDTRPAPWPANAPAAGPHLEAIGPGTLRSAPT